MSQAGRPLVASGMYAPGVQPGSIMQQQCAFPAPPPNRVYCMPAPFSATDGRTHHVLVDAYGKSRPSRGHY